jgi:hypothetical protein
VPRTHVPVPEYLLAAVHAVEHQAALVRRAGAIGEHQYLVARHQVLNLAVAVTEPDLGRVLGQHLVDLDGGRAHGLELLSVQAGEALGLAGGDEPVDVVAGGRVLDERSFQLLADRRDRAQADIGRGQVTGGQSPVDGASRRELVAEEDLEGDEVVALPWGEGAGGEVREAGEGELDPVRGDEATEVGPHTGRFQHREVGDGHSADRLAFARDRVRHPAVVEDGVVVRVLEDADAFPGCGGRLDDSQVLGRVEDGHHAPRVRRHRAVIGRDLLTGDVRWREVLRCRGSRRGPGARRSP